MGCLSADAVLAFVEGRLGPEGVAELEAHTAGCAACLDLLVTAASEADRGGPDGALPSPPLRIQLTRPVPDPLPHGTAVGRYLLIALLGRGGMGEIRRGLRSGAGSPHRHQAPQRRAESGGTSAEARARLLREAKAHRAALASERGRRVRRRQLRRAGVHRDGARRGRDAAELARRRAHVLARGARCLRRGGARPGRGARRRAGAPRLQAGERDGRSRRRGAGDGFRPGRGLPSDGEPAVSGDLGAAGSSARFPRAGGR